MELWKDIPNFEGLYQASINGEIRSIYRYKKILKQSKSKNGYLKVMLCANGKRKLISVHRLVAETFIPNPNNYPIVNHVNGNKIDNHISNLEWCTYKQNIQHALLNGRFDNMRKINSERIKLNPLNGYIYANELTKKRVGKFDEFGCIEIYESISEASRKTGISIASISYSANGKRATGGGYIWHFV